jgi:hypothetical protein
MGHQIIRQPDGRLCVFSTVVDDFVYADCDPEPLIEHYAAEAAQDTRERVRRVIENVLSGNPQKSYYQFTMTYEEALAESRRTRS